LFKRDGFQCLELEEVKRGQPVALDNGPNQRSIEREVVPRRMALFPEHHEFPFHSQHLLLLHERDYFHESVAISQGVPQDVLFD
jgi:hypothetical protein